MRYAEVRDLAEPKVPEAPALVLSGQPDLKIYVSGSTADVEKPSDASHRWRRTRAMAQPSSTRSASLLPRAAWSPRGCADAVVDTKVPEAPALVLSGQPDLKIYDRLLTGGLVTAGVCG